MALALPGVANVATAVVERATTIPYTITDFGPPGGDLSSGAYAIKYAGQVAGYTAGEGFLYEQGLTTHLGTLGGNSSAGLGMNEVGHVVGSASVSGEARHAFLWTMTGTVGVPSNPQMQDLGVLDGQTSAALDINDLGQVVGNWNDGNPHPFIWDNVDGMQDLSPITGLGNARAINNAGQVAGTFGLWQSGVVTPLGTLGGSYTVAYDINESGALVGNSQTANGNVHAFLWEDDIINDLHGSVINNSRATAINDRGQAVGFWYPNERAFLYHGSQLHDLNELIDEGSGWVLEQAFDINNRGQIVGYGSFNGDRHAFLLTPIPTPTTAAMIMIGLGMSLASRRQFND